MKVYSVIPHEYCLRGRHPEKPKVVECEIPNPILGKKGQLTSRNKFNDGQWNTTWGKGNHFLTREAAESFAKDMWERNLLGIAEDEKKKQIIVQAFEDAGILELAKSDKATRELADADNRYLQVAGFLRMAGLDTAWFPKLMYALEPRFQVHLDPQWVSVSYPLTEREYAVVELYAPELLTDLDPSRNCFASDAFVFHFGFSMFLDGEFLPQLSESLTKLARNVKAMKSVFAASKYTTEVP